MSRLDPMYTRAQVDAKAALLQTDINGRQKDLGIKSVKDFGAVGDGVTDDITEINAAIDAATALAGLTKRATVSLESGKVYGVSSSVIMKSGVTLDLNGSVITPLTTPYTYSLVVNYRATTTVPTDNDSKITVKNGILDGKSTGFSNDSCLGYGIGFFGADDTVIEDVIVQNTPLSGIEIQSNYAATAVHGLPTSGGTAPTIQSNRTTIRNVQLNHIGWQEAYLSGTPLAQWGDAGFGIIGRSGTRGLFIDNSRAIECEVNCFGVGQMATARANGDPPTNAHVSDIHFSNLYADQTSAVSHGTLSPTYRIAFAARAMLTNCVALGNTDSTGFEVRSAGSTEESATERVVLSNCISEGNNFGFSCSTQGDNNATRQVVLNNCIAKGNLTSGFISTQAQVVMNGCQSVENGVHGFRIYHVAGTSPTTKFDSVLSGCLAADNGSGAGSSDCGILLEDCEYVTVTGCNVADTRSGGSRTQDYGIREIGTATNNIVVGNTARNNITANLAPGSTASRWNHNIGQAQSVVKSADTTKNNNSTIAADPHLTIELLPNSIYKIETHLIIDGSNTADFKWNWTIPSGATGYQQADGLATATTGTTGSMNEAGQLFTNTPAIATAGVGTKTIATPQGVLVTGATGGSLTFNWAQSTADATDTTLFAGSTLIATRLG